MALLLKGLLLILLTVLGFTAGLPINPTRTVGDASSQRSSTAGAAAQGYNGTVPIRAAGVDAVPDLSLPKTTLSSVNNLIGAGGVIQASPQNLTLYNSAISIRLLGNPSPRDLLLDQSGKILSSYNFWSAQLSLNGTWVSLASTSNSFNLLGTNKTGTFVVRTMNVGWGAYSGLLRIVYKATSAGPLKWDLEFTPTRSGQYRLLHSWSSVTSYQLSSLAKQFRARFGNANYTLRWDDVPASYQTLASATSNEFSLSISLGEVTANSKILVDPSLVSTSTSLWATAYSMQRKVFFDPKGGYYFVFYYNGSTVSYRSSHDGISWSLDQQMPTGWPGFVDNATSLPGVFSSGQNVVMATGDKASTTSTASVALRYWVGTIAGSRISWGTTQTAVTISRTDDSANPTTFGIRYVNLVASSNGMIAFSYNWYARGFGHGGQGRGNCISSADYSESGVYVTYNATNLVSQCNTYTTGLDAEQDRSVIVPWGSNGKVRAVYQFHVSNRIELFSQWLDPNGSPGPIETVDGSSLKDTDDLSAVSDANYGTNLVYRNAADNNITYAYRSTIASGWSYSKNILFAGVDTWPTLTLDYSTDNLYLFAAQVGLGRVDMKVKTPAGTWQDGTFSYPITGLSQIAPAYLGSNLVSASASNSTTISLIWTEQNGFLFNVGFASIPIATAWSPYSSPHDPWDGNGIAPYGQYFSNLGEYVSPGSGMLTVRQTDLTVTGRGLDLGITRVYTEPYRFLSGSPYGYESYPWAPLGNGWQLNFPWMATTSGTPAYLHLSDGQGYRIPSSFWTGLTASYDNHQGVNFRLSRYIDGTIVLFTSTGLSYYFDPSHRLANVTDATALNSIVFNYDVNNHISKITDTIGRAFVLCYANNLLHSINQTTSTCASSIGSVRGLVYNYNSYNDLVNATDPAGRTIAYKYDPSHWLITRITYPTTWYDAYSYSTFTSGTQAYIYRVNWQQVNATQTNPIRSFKYTYTSGAGDQINNSTVATFDGGGTQPVSFTSYAFSFAGIAWNISDSSHNLVRGDLQRFNINGEIPRETIVVYDRSGLGWPPGSYTNYYSYDLWGNQIYSRRTILQPTQSYDKGPWYHESFSSYYNGGLAPAFNAFQDTFSQNQGTAPDNSWNVTNGYWIVNNGVYNGTETAGKQESTFASFNIGKTDISIQARIYIARQVNASDARIGLIDHYPGSGINKWALVLHNSTSGIKLSLLDESVSWVVENSCTLLYSTWYTFNFTTRGNTATGWASTPGVGTCTVSGTFPSDSLGGAGGFGLYAGGYSALFDDVQVTTVSPQITRTGFSNSFFANGAPGPVGLNTWLTTTKPPGPGWNTTTNWLPATGWSQAYASQNYGGSPWNSQVNGWPDINAQWIWSNGNANVSAPKDPVWFRRVFNLAATTNINMTITSDNTYVLYVDGLKLGQQLTLGSAWQTLHSYTDNLPAGYHVLAINATNPDGPDAAGLLVSVSRANSARVLFRTDATAGRVILALAGSAEFQNVTATAAPIPIEGYDSYYAWGGLNQTKQLYSSPGGNHWPSTSRTYDSYGNMLQIVDALGNTTSYAYSPTYRSAYLTSETKPYFTWYPQIITSYGYNLTVGTRIWVQEPNGYGTSDYNTTYRYDILSRPTRIMYPNGDYNSYTYNDRSNYVDVTNENGWHARQVYDGLGRLSVNEKILGTSTFNETYSYNSQDKVVAQTDQLGHLYTYQFDPLGRLTQTRLPDGNTTQILYNDVRSWVKHVDENGYWRFSVYDRLGRLIESDDPLYLGVNSALYYYDEVGNLQSTCFANSQSSCEQQAQYSYDSLNQMTKTQYADNTTEQYAYDNNGNVVRKTDRKGIRATISYDTLNRPLNITYGGITNTTETYFFDNTGNLLDLYLQNTTIAYSYDSRNRVLQEAYYTFVQPSWVSYATNFTYTGETLSRITYPDGLKVNYTYDAMGRATKVFKSGSSSYYATINYYSTNQVKSIAYGNGLWANYTYDSLSRPSTITLAGNGRHGQYQLLSLAYNYNKTGTVALVNGQVNSVTLREQYNYDPIGRLTNATLTSGSTQTNLAYQYDSLGNMLSRKQNGQTTVYVYNSGNNELQSSSNGSTSTVYSYDANGNLLTKNVTTTGTSHWTYAWDVLGHLVKVANDTGTKGLYVYDAKGRLVGSKEGPKTNLYAYLATETLYQNTVGSSTTNYLFARGVRIGKVTGNTVSYYHSDAQGSTRLVTGSSASVVFSDNYQPFGQDNGTPTGAETYKFAGKPSSPATGLYYYYHRWYDLSTGRFISEDPNQGRLSQPQSLNRYIYVVNNPVGNNDPTGECPWCVAAVIGAVAGFAVGYGACVYSGGGWGTKCLAQGGEGALIGAIGGATFGLGLGALGVGAGGATLGETLLAGSVSGTITGLYSFDISALSGQHPTTSDLETDLEFGFVTGVVGAGVSYILPGAVTVGPTARDLETTGSSALNKVGVDATKVPKIGVVIIGGGLEVGKAVVSTVVDPIIHNLSDWLGLQSEPVAASWVYYSTPGSGKGRAIPT